MFWIKHRKAILWALYILFFVHAIIWYLCGWQKIGQFGFGEIFFTLKTGIVTAGTIFVLVVFIHALFFGGIFCGWFCHWGVTQDVAAWIMEKCGIKPVMRHLNSKLIPWVWFIILLTQVVLFWYFNGFPTSLSIDLAGPEMGVLIGKRGQTLDSLQYLTNLAVNRSSENYTRVKIDTEDYRRRRKETLENLAKNMASKVKRTKKAVTLEAMNPYERRIIHSALQNDNNVTTHSEGEEPYRYVVITLKK